MIFRSRRDRGFSLIELLMVIMIVTTLAVVSIDVISDTLKESRFEATVEKMSQIRNAMIGNLDLKEAGVRSSFGFLGDIGGIPSAAQGISALVSQPSPALPVYALNATARIGLGWNGPYLTGGSTGTDYTKDAWGTNFVYTPASGTLVSYGANRVAGGTGFDQDITVSMPTELRTATVNGFICNKGGPMTELAEVEINYPNGSGVLTSPTDSVTVAEKGQFSFSNVPFGIRSLTVYRPAKTGATSTLGPVIITIDRPNFNVPCNQIDIGS